MFDDKVDTIFFVVVIIAFVFIVGSILIGSQTPPIEINSSEIQKHIDQKVSVVINVLEKVDSGTKLDFMMPIIIPHTMSTGKTVTVYNSIIFVPIFENYNVYTTKEGVYLAIDKDKTEDIRGNSTVNVIGHVRKEEESNRYAIDVEEVR